MDRSAFLKNSWVKFPAANRTWSDVSSFNREGSGLVCGRLTRFSEETWQIASGGSTLAFDFSRECAWLAPQSDTVFSESLLRNGDLACVELIQAGDGWRAARCLLLVPSGGEFSLVTSFNLQRSRDWAEFVSALRGFFSSRGFIEAATPTLVHSPGTEPFLEPFKTKWEFGARSEEFFLPTSPEFHLKKMLAAGWTRIFELKTCFRNGELGKSHQAEFTMLEWYRAYANLEQIASDVAELFASLAEVTGKNIAPLERTTMKALFAENFSGFSLRAHTSRSELVVLADKLGVRSQENDSWDEIFYRIFLEKIEPTLGARGPILVHGYPPSQAALSRICDDGFADRFEIYWRGLELANAFHELNDPAENARRFAEDAAVKKQLAKPSVPLDAGLTLALAHGLPPSGGIALGVDRLFMAFYGIENIADSRAFPL